MYVYFSGETKKEEEEEEIGTRDFADAENGQKSS